MITIQKIEKSVPNIPKVLNGRLLIEGKNYSVAATLDSIRHLADEKSLSRDDIVDYLDRMADTIVEFDTVSFDYYYEKGNRMNGVLFKKEYKDGTIQSFEIVSNKKRTDNWLMRNRLQLPFGITNYGPVKSITYPDGNVNSNGYNDGYYNIIVTQYQPDDFSGYLSKYEIVYDKKKMNGRYQVGSGRVVTFTHDTPFISNSIRNSDEKSNEQSVKKRSGRVTASFR